MFTRNEYLRSLKKNLKKNKVDKIDEIINDVNEIFDVKLSEGKSEGEIILELGKPEDVAKQYFDEKAVSVSKKTSKIKIVFIWICSFLALAFTYSAILIGTGMIDIDQTKQFDEHLGLSLYVENSETKFQDGFIKIKIVNVAEVDFIDLRVFLTYDGPHVGSDYTEQKVVTIEANSSKTISFTNPGWTYTYYNTVFANVNKGDSGTGVRLHSGNEFIDYRASHKNDQLYLTIAESLLASLFLIIDIILIVRVIKSKKEKSN